MPSNCEKILELLPEEIEELYNQMFRKIDKVYRKEVGSTVPSTGA